MDGLELVPPFRFTLAPAEGYRFDPEKRVLLRSLTKLIFFRLSEGRLGETEAAWETKTVIRGLYALECARMFLRKKEP